MDALQGELQNTYPLLNVQIFGVNEAGYESGNHLMTEGRSTPLLQDVDENANQTSDVWYELWNVQYRDVIILDGSNSVVDTYNLTVHNIATPENYEALREKLLDAAMAEQKPYQNSLNRFDVDNDGHVVPKDVLYQINNIDSEGARKLEPPTGTEPPSRFFDCDGDGWFVPQDVLDLVNYLNEHHENPDGEATSNPVHEFAYLSASQFVKQESTSIEDLANLDPGSPDSEQTASISHYMAAGSKPAVAESVAADASHDVVPDDSFWAEYWPNRALFETK